jgi:hypothetical protein
VKVERRNWRAGNWEELKKMLKGELEALPMADGYASVEEVEAAITELDAAIQRCVEAHIPLSKISPHSKRWWTAKLTELKKERNKVARRSWRQKEIQDSPVHEEYRKARNHLSAELRKA